MKPILVVRLNCKWNEHSQTTIIKCTDTKMYPTGRWNCHQTGPALAPEAYQNTSDVLASTLVYDRQKATWCMPSRCFSDKADLISLVTLLHTHLSKRKEFNQLGLVFSSEQFPRWFSLLMGYFKASGVWKRVWEALENLDKIAAF